MSLPLLSLEVRLEPDIVLARQRARQIAGLLGFHPLDQTRIATAVSETARNAFEYAGGGRVEFLVESGLPAGLSIRVRERGPGVKGLDPVPGGPYGSAPVGGQAASLTKRLMDRFDVEQATPSGGAVISMVKVLPKRTAPFTPKDLTRVADELARQAPRGLLEELQQQNQELLRTLQELRDSQAEIAHLHTRELEETNRGVVALYAELDDNAKALKRISDLKSRFLSNMSHEFRSPLNTILSLTGFLMDRSDGELSAEQEKQVYFIRKAAEGLAGLVNDLLDLAKVEAGKAVIRPESFEVGTLFDVLRGTTRPLLGPRQDTALVFEEPAGIPTLRTDEAKLTQILRNFLSNAVKYTERGEIRVSVATGPGDTVIFSVADTGIGIAPEDRARVFEEFGQVEGPAQGRIKGTGLGLPLSRKLAELLGGTVSFRSEPGVGSTFYVLIPCRYREQEGEASHDGREPLDSNRSPVLVVEDDPMDLLLYEKGLEGSGYQVLPARNLDEARRILRKVRPLAVLLDIILEAESGWTLLTEMKGQEATRDIPVLVLTSVDGQERALALGADEFCLKPIDPAWLLEKLESLGGRRGLGTILIVDDEESHRYVLKELLSRHGRFDILEASDGQEGLELARGERPSVIFLDLVMPDMTGFEILERLKSDPDTREIPVIINSSRTLEDGELGRLNAASTAILSKGAGTQDERFARVREALVKAGLSPALPGAEL